MGSSPFQGSQSNVDEKACSLLSIQRLGQQAYPHPAPASAQQQQQPATSTSLPLSLRNDDDDSGLTISASLRSTPADMAMRAAAGAAFSAGSVRHGHFETVSAATRAPAGMSLVSWRHGVSPKCRVAHSLVASSSRKPATSVVRRVKPIKMELETTATPTTEADSLSDEEGPLPTGPVDVSQHVAVLKRAAKTKKVPPTEVFAAIRAIEKAKVEPSGFLEYLGGTQSPGRTWMLVFSVSKEVVREALNGGPGGGKYLPVSAIQNFDASAMRIENGIYLGPLGALAFEGRFSLKNRILAFLFDKLKIKIGILPAFTVNIGKKADEGRSPGNSDPFFIWFYADDEIIVAKGRGGGLAFWCRCKRVSEKF